MRRGQRVRIRLDIISPYVKNTMSDFQRFNNPTVSKYDKATRRIQVKWWGNYPMWFDLEQVEKVDSECIITL